MPHLPIRTEPHESILVHRECGDDQEWSIGAELHQGAWLLHPGPLPSSFVFVFQEAAIIPEIVNQKVMIIERAPLQCAMPLSVRGREGRGIPVNPPPYCLTSPILPRSACPL